MEYRAKVRHLIATGELPPDEDASRSAAKPGGKPALVEPPRSALAQLQEMNARIAERQRAAE
jgi:hypothetical protein